MSGAWSIITASSGRRDRSASRRSAPSPSSCLYSSHLNSRTCTEDPVADILYNFRVKACSIKGDVPQRRQRKWA